MLSRTFTVKEHEEYGSIGLQPDWVGNQAMVEPIGGMGAAHDILEHPINGIGGAENEFMALGAMYWIRGQNNWWARGGNVRKVEEHMTSDYEQILPRIFEGYETLKDPGRTYRLSDECAEECFRSSVNIGFRNVISEREEYDQAVKDLIHAGGKERIIGWLRKGYRMAQKRYRGIDNYHLSYVFSRIEKALDKELKHADEGMKVKVQIDLERGLVRAESFWPEDY